MSHNKFKVSTVSADRTSSISLDLGDLGDVSSTSPSSGEFLEWGGTEWAGATPSGGSSGVIFIGEGASQDYNNSSSASSILGTNVEFYDSSPINTISGATITSSSNWISSVTLPAGTYLFEAAIALTFSTTSNGIFRFYNGTSYFGIEAQYGSTDFQTGIVCRTTATFTSATTVSVRTTAGASLNTKSAQGVRQAQRAMLSIIQSN